MKTKKIIIYGLIALVLIVIGSIAYIMLTTKSHSPADQIVYTDGDFNLTLDYCKPYKKGRLVFGPESEEALVPYGKYWRTGANESSEIEFSHDISIQGKSIPAGRYRFYTIPDKDSWVIGLNSELGEWGYGEPDYDQDILRVSVPSEKSNILTEQFTIVATETGDNEISIVLSWDETNIRIPVTY